MTTLKSIYEAHTGKVSDKWELYLQAYDEAFAPWRDKPVRMLEIGIQNGGSLEIWPRYFPAGTLFVGCDINPDCARLAYDDPRVQLLIGDANASEVIERIDRLSSKFDLVIEDGSHTSIDIVRSFANFFPRVAEDGLFVAEDLHCSYWMQFGGGLHHPYSAMTFFKHLADIVNQEHWGVPGRRAEMLGGFHSAYGVDLAEDLLAQVHSVTFVNSLCFVRKRRAAVNVLGRRVLAGSTALVVDREALSGSQLAPDQTANPFSQQLAPAEEAELLHREEAAAREARLQLQLAEERERANTMAALLREVQQHLEVTLQAAQARADQLQAHADQLQARADELQAHVGGLEALAEARMRVIEAMRGSRTWRAMEPVRAAGTAARSVYSIVRRASGLTRRVAERASREQARGVSPATLVARAAKVLARTGPAGLVRSLREFGQPAGALGAAQRDDAQAYAAWIAAHEFAPVPQRSAQGLVSVVVPVCNTPANFLDELFASLCAQTYSEWELCIHDDASDRPDTAQVLKRLQATGRSVRVSRGDRRQGISAATNAALASATGRWVAFVDHDDVLAPQALADCVHHLVEHGIEVVYTDHDVLDGSGRRCHPYFKPDFNLDLLLAQMYIGHLVVADRDAVLRTGGLRSEMDGAQDYDLILRLLAAGARIGHVPEVLYHWRQHAGSTAGNPGSKPYAHDAGRRAVQAFLDRNRPGALVEDGEFTFCYDVRYRANAVRMASIIIPTRDRLDLLEVCIRTLIARTQGVAYEIIIVDNGSKERETLAWLEAKETAGVLRVIRADVPFNWSALNNLAAAQARGDVLVFLNNDTEFVEGGWLQRLCENALRSEVGCCGPLLTYADGTIQHAGVVVGMGGWADHVFKGLPVTHTQSYFTSPVLRRDVLALTGACLAIAKDKFDSLGRFDESFIVCGSDVELCLRAHQAGLLNVYIPEARVVHHESKTRDPRAIPEQDFVRSAQSYEPYRTQGDPFYNPNLDRMSPVPALGVNK